MFTRAVVLTLMGAFLTSSAAAQEASLDEALGKYYEAIGGLEAWKAVQSMKTVSNSKWARSGYETHNISFVKRPGMMRTESTRAGGVTAIRAFDGEEAWSIKPDLSTRPQLLEAWEADLAKTGADIDGLLIGYEEDGHQVELLGLAEVEGTQAYQLKITRADGDVEYYYLDAERFLPIKVQYRKDFGGGERDIEVLIKDYRDVGGGLMVAHEGESGIVDPLSHWSDFYYYTVEKVELNVDIDDSVFKMPKTEGGDRKG